MKTYKEAKNFMEDGRNPKDRPISSRASTRVQRRDENTIAVKYHETDVVTYKADGTYILDSGGWKTKTTQARIEEYTPFYINQIDGVWFLSSVLADNTINFKDGIEIHIDQDRQEITAEGQKRWEQVENDSNLRKKITEYSKAVSEALVNGELEAPSRSDCEECRELLKYTDGEYHRTTPGHIRQHVINDEYIPSLVAYVITQPQMSEFCERKARLLLAGAEELPLAGFLSAGLKRQLTSAMKRYLKISLNLVV
jgi:hypothetical protein